MSKPSEKAAELIAELRNGSPGHNITLGRRMTTSRAAMARKLVDSILKQEEEDKLEKEKP